MITANEIREARFDKAMFNGYNPEQVDKLIDDAADAIDALNKELQIAKDQMKSMEDRLQEQRKNEKAIQEVMLTAQLMANRLVEEAKGKSEAMLNDAKNIVEKRREELNDGVKMEEAKYKAAKSMTNGYIDGILAQLAENVEKLQTLKAQVKPAPGEEEAPKMEAPTAPIPVVTPEMPESESASPVSDINNIMNVVMKQAKEESKKAAPASPEDEESIEWDELIKGKKQDSQEKKEDDDRFAGLKFGKEFEIK